MKKIKLTEETVSKMIKQGHALNKLIAINAIHNLALYGKPAPAMTKWLKEVLQKEYEELTIDIKTSKRLS